MTPATLDVVGIGNAIVDVIAHADERFLAAEGLAKGAMTLIDADARRGALREDGAGDRKLGRLGRATRWPASPRSAAGTGRLYRQGARRHAGASVPPRHHRDRRPVRHAAPPPTGRGTARCLILVTPDGQRTMATYLGACVELGPEDIDAGLIEAAADHLSRRLSVRPAAGAGGVPHAPPRIAHAAGRRVALSLSDPFCVDRHRAAFRELVTGEVDILFANEAEICSLYETDDFDAGRRRGARPCRDRGADPQRAGSVMLGGAARRTMSPPRRSITSPTPPAPATSTPPASSTA